MARAATSAGGAHSDLVDVEAGTAETFGKGGIGPRRPDSEHAAGSQRRLRRCEAARGVEPVIALSGQPFRPIVNIEQNGIEGRALRSDDFADVGLPDADPD